MDTTLKTEASHKATTPSGDGQGVWAPLAADELRKLDAAVAQIAASYRGWVDRFEQAK